jgi:hypothetical protein
MRLNERCGGFLWEKSDIKMFMKAVKGGSKIQKRRHARRSSQERSRRVKDRLLRMLNILLDVLKW